MAANNDDPSLIRAIRDKNIVECRRLISKIQGRLMSMEIEIMSMGGLLYIGHPI